MIQECGVCGAEIETGGFGAAPMFEHYKAKHPSEFYGPPDGYEETTLDEWTGDKERLS